MTRKTLTIEEARVKAAAWNASRRITHGFDQIVTEASAPQRQHIINAVVAPLATAPAKELSEMSFEDGTAALAESWNTSRKLFRSPFWR